MLAFGLAIAAVMTALLAVFAWPYLIKPAATLCLVAAAIGAHFMLGYGIVIDPTMMTNVLQTDVREARDLLSPRLRSTLLLLAGAAARLALAPAAARRARCWSQAWRNLASSARWPSRCCCVLAVFADLSATMRNHRTLRYLINPLNPSTRSASSRTRARRSRRGRSRPSAPDARLAPRPAGARPPLLVLVVGETARADHFSLNGYARPTNPELAQRERRELPQRHLLRHQHRGLAAVHVLGPRPRRLRAHKGDAGEPARRGCSAPAWPCCGSTTSRAARACATACRMRGGRAAPGVPPPAAGLCHDGECYDEALLAGLDARLAALPAERRARGVLLVLHQMGSHGPAYCLRSPPGRKPFQPECRPTCCSSATAQAIVNAYDNTIAYTDHVLAGAIDWLGRQSAHYDAALLYVSDHGESLGENNLYLHGLPWSFAPREQKHVPMIVWLAPQTQAELGIRSTACAERRDAALSHDNLFHTALGYLGVATQAYRRGARRVRAVPSR